jgi:predicted nucleotidyltransferase
LARPPTAELGFRRAHPPRPSSPSDPPGTSLPDRDADRTAAVGQDHAVPHGVPAQAVHHARSAGRPPVRSRGYAVEDPRGFLAEHLGGAILDEIQRAPALLSYLQGEVDERPAPGRFILTGSANLASLASVSQSLAGRTALLELLPLSLSDTTPQALGCLQARPNGRAEHGPGRYARPPLRHLMRTATCYPVAVPALSPEASFQIRKAECRLRALQLRREQLIERARAAAEVLRAEFGARRIWLFGSLRHGWFHETSDVDLAVEGIALERIGAAWDRVAEVVACPVDLVCWEDASPALRARVEETGEVLP